MVSQIKSWSQCNLSDGIRDVRGWEFPLDTIQYNTIQILLSTPHGGFSETSINSTGNQKKKKDPDARQRCKASEKTQGTNCIALFFAVIPVHWQHELAQSLLLSCL